MGMNGKTDCIAGFLVYLRPKPTKTIVHIDGLQDRQTILKSCKYDEYNSLQCPLKNAVLNWPHGALEQDKDGSTVTAFYPRFFNFLGRPDYTNDHAFFSTMYFSSVVFGLQLLWIRTNCFCVTILGEVVWKCGVKTFPLCGQETLVWLLMGWLRAVVTDWITAAGTRECSHTMQVHNIPILSLRYLPEDNTGY